MNFKTSWLTAVLLILTFISSFSWSQDIRLKDEAGAQSSLIYFDVCAIWANARGHYDYYRTCKDRPFAAGDVDARVWQVAASQQQLPGSVLVIDVLQGTGNRNDKQIAAFANYLKATESVPGGKVAPLLDITQPRSDPEEARINAAADYCRRLLKEYGQHEGWARINGMPLITDYHMAGLGLEGLKRVQKILKDEGHKFVWIADFGAYTQWSVYGRVKEDLVQGLLENCLGVYAFGSPVLDMEEDGVRPGYQRLAATVRKVGTDRLFGGGVSSGTWSSRLGQRNYVSAMGTQRLRAAIESLLASGATIIGGQTWNDYVEAGHFEPSYKHTTALLEIMRAYLSTKNFAPPIVDRVPHVVVSYRKNIAAGEPLSIEVLNLPLQNPFGVMTGTIIVSKTTGEEITRFPFKLDGGKIDATTVLYESDRSVPAFDITIELAAEAGQQAGSFQNRYINLPPVPVAAADFVDPLYYSVPLHRLYTKERVNVKVNGKIGVSRSTSPRLLNTDATQPILGVSYLKNGAIINDPTGDTASAPVVENWPDDPTTLLPANDYYAALVEFKDNTIAYTSLATVDSNSDQRIWCDYIFRKENMFDIKPVGKNKLVDRSPRQRHGTFVEEKESKLALPQWVSIVPQHDALRFKKSVVSLPLSAFPAGPLTIELLIKPASFGKAQSLISQGGRCLNLAIAPDGTIVAERMGNSRLTQHVQSSEKAVLDQWNYVVGAYDGRYLKLYLNGKLQGQVESFGVRTLESASLGGGAKVGVPPDLANEFDGQMARLKILSGASNTAEIQIDTDTLRSIYTLP